MKRILILALIGLIYLSIPAWLPAAEFTCDDGAGGEVMCIIQRGGDAIRISCKRGSLFEVKWVCSQFPETERTLCRSRDGQQRMLPLAEYENDAALCSSLCFCP